jgi:tyrosine-specific transport protein
MNKTLGASLLISGCCIGAGMLGIPVVTAEAGFYPSLLFFVIAWAFMTAAGLLLAKLVLSFNKPEIHLLSMADATLGRFGKLAAWMLFAFLFYAIMTAYVIAAGVLISDCTGLNFQLAALGLGAGMFVAIARGVRLVDSLNRYLLFGMVACYLLLVCFGLPSVDIERLDRANFSAAWASLPILVICFGFHNLIPSLATYLKQDAKALRKAIITGSLISLVIYLMWEFVILGLVPEQNIADWISAEKKGELVTQVLADTVGSKTVVVLAQGFAFLAIATSFLPVAFSFLDFLKDGLKEVHKKASTKTLALVVLIPPLLLSVSDPHLFLEALDFAGGICAVSIFGILPAVMAAKRGIVGPLYWGLILAVSLVVFSIELAHQLGYM